MSRSTQAMLLLASLVVVPAAADHPEAVSPGASEHFELVAGPCPTFSWTQLVGREGPSKKVSVELELLGMTPVDQPFDEMANLSDAVIRVELPGEASSWTPSLESCPPPGAAYGWHVRWIVDGTPGAWSKTLFFTVGGEPSAVKMAGRPGPSATDPTNRPALRGRSESSATPSTPAESEDPDKPVSHAPSAAAALESAVAAVHAEAPPEPGPDSPTFGAVGITDSASGAGVGADNIAGGPDLRLEGDTPALVDEARIDRPAPTDLTFEFSNSDSSGSIELLVDGETVLTEATGALAAHTHVGDCPSGGCNQTNAFGTCTGVYHCTDTDGNGVLESSCTAPVPAAEACDGLDNDCDGAFDEELTSPACPLDDGVCAGVVQICGGGLGWLDCNYGPFYQVVETACDGLDNDCDDELDEGYRNPATGKYDTTEACGDCATDCTGSVANATAICNATGVPFCSFEECDPGYFDVNADPTDGCEFSLDQDAIYVSVGDVSADNDPGCGRGPAGTGAGNRPCRSITRGIEEADDDSRSRVLVADGVYLENVALTPGINLLGGHDATSWLRSVATTQTAIAGVNGAGDRKTVTAQGISLATVVEGFVIYGQSATSPGANSYAVYVSDSDANLMIVNNLIRAGNGAPGDPGTVGAGGAPGGNGDPGQDAVIYPGGSRLGGSGGASDCGATGGLGGGNIAAPAYNTETSGLDGATPPGGGTGGDAGDDAQLSAGGVCTLPTNPKEGVTGQDGSAGTHGTAGLACLSGSGSVIGGEWRALPGSAGGPGANGAGGGGGGAGGGGECSGCDDGMDRWGATGGGGGGGGCGGTGGTGGVGGGGSFGVFVHFTVAPTTGNLPVIDGNQILQGSGGAAGSGGNGGSGGSAGSGGTGGAQDVNNAFCGFEAGAGGGGGSGGQGGGGGGACGGVSYGIYAWNFGSDPHGYCDAGNLSFGGAPGPGGSGGSAVNSGGTGAPGDSGQCN